MTYPPERTPSNDPGPIALINPEFSVPLLLIADHAGRAVPAHMHDAVGPLGLPDDMLEQHVGWDIGAGEVAGRLAEALKATAVLSVYTRLLIDPNRPLGDADSIPERSDGILIPANQALSFEQQQKRATDFYWPYHTAVDRELARLKQGGRTPLLVSVHSFTPELMFNGSPRPWHVGVMASRDLRMADLLIAALKAEPGLVVGFNEPYSGITHGYCMKMHGLAQGLPHAQIEIRQDLIGAAGGQQRWADLLARVLKPIVADTSFQSIAHY